MFKNYIKIAFRSLWKHKLFTLINMISLAVGLCASFVIGLLVYYEFTFDTFHPDANRIYRITTDFYTPDGDFHNRGVPVPLYNTIKQEVTDIEEASSFFSIYPQKVREVGIEQIFKNPKHVLFADAYYFNVFPYEWLAGNAHKTLSVPNQVVLTQNRAEKYFPGLLPREILGRTLVYNDSVFAKVTGIVANFTNRSDLIFEEFISTKTATQTSMGHTATDTHWNSTNSASQLFIKIRENAPISGIRERLGQLALQHEDEALVQLGQKRRFHLQPLEDIHFNPDYGIFDSSSGQASKGVLWGLACIAIFLLLLGCINFINLNTAQATYRAREIGIRKTLGGAKRQLIFQFLTETFILTFTAALISMIFSFWLLRIFHDFVPEGLQFELFGNTEILVFIATLLVLVAFLSGFYPALVLSNFKPIAVLKNQITLPQSKPVLRKSLTVFQFVIAQLFIIATLLVGKQIHYVMEKDMGFRTSAIAFVWTPGNNVGINKRMRLLNEIKAHPPINNVSLGGPPPASFNMSSTITSHYNNETESHTSLQLLFGDETYLDLYDIALLAGRKPLNDTIREYVINETYLKVLGYKTPQEALGRFLKVDTVQNPIVGVMKDFNQRSLRSEIKPMAFIGDWDRNLHSQFNTIHFSLPMESKEEWPDIIAQIDNSWKSIYPDTDMEIQFMDDIVGRFYEQERRVSRLLQWATGLSILISCLGLFGLVIYTTERRTREIGIRKVLGATLAQLNLLLCSDFLILVGIAFVLAAPVAWLGLNYWLESFAFKTALSWWIFAVGGIAMAGVALIVMSIKTIALAKTNPVKSLRTE